MDSILQSVKKLLGISEEYDHFDQDIMLHINSVFSILFQLGVGPDEPFQIEDEDATWDQFLDDLAMIDCVKSYVYLRVKNLFDPPTTSFNLDAVKNMISELEWRMTVMMESENINQSVDPNESEEAM